MENEISVRITNVKDTCKILDENLHERYEILKARGDLSEADKTEMIRDVIEVQKIYRTVNNINILESEKRLEDLEESLAIRYGLSILDRSNNKNVIREKITEEKVEEKKSLAGPIIGGFIAGTLVATAAGHIICANKKIDAEIAKANIYTNDKDITREEEVVVEEFEKVEEKEEAKEEPKKEVKEETEEVNEAIDLVLGEYGTFLDASNDEQVEARAQYIFDNYFSKFMGNLCSADKALISVPEIANTIRVVNGELPVDESGNRYFDPNVTDYYLNRLIDFLGNVPSCDVMGTVEYVPGYLFAIDGSKTSEFIKSYDEIYKNIADARNNRDGEKFVHNAKIMAAKYWTEWFLQGMGGNIVYSDGEISYEGQVPANAEAYTVRDPYALNETYKYFAYCATMYRYSTFIYEAEHNMMSTVCIPACINYSTKDIEELSIDEIYTAIDTGIWNDIIARTAGVEAPVDPVCVGFWESLNDILTFKYNELKQLTLK